MQLMEDAPKEPNHSLRIRLVKRIITLLLISYLLFVFTTAILLFAVDKPMDTDTRVETYSVHMDRVALIESGSEGAKVRLGLVEAANTSIDIAYYTVTRGKYSKTLLSFLLNAADRGVQVRILQDGLTCIAYEKGALKDAMRGLETHPNIEVRYYEKFNPLVPWAWHNRLHDKTMLVDGKLALIGGRNIGDKYFLKDAYQNRFVKDRDALICKEGAHTSVIGDMQSYYDEIWNYKHTKPYKKKLTARQTKRGSLSNTALKEHYTLIRQEYPELFQKIDWGKRTMPSDGVQFAHNPLGRGNSDPWCLKLLLHLASQAEQSITVQSPYIIPTRAMRALAKRYDIDWNTVSILTNSARSSPNPIAMAAYHNHRNDIVDKTYQVYEFQGPASIHSKSYIFDDSISVIGTFNLDARSSYINTESMVLIRGEGFAQELGAHMAKERSSSALVGEDYTYKGKAEDKRPLWLFSKAVGLFGFLL